MFDTNAVYPSDTDVLLLFLAYHHHCDFQGLTYTVSCKIGQGSNSKIYNVNVNARAISLNTYQSLPFFHAFTRCGTMSSFLNHSKKSMWKVLHKYSNH